MCWMMLVADGACFTRILSFLFESNALLVCASYRHKKGAQTRLLCDGGVEGC